MMSIFSIATLEYPGDQSRFAQSVTRLVNMIPKNLKTATGLHLMIVLCLVTSVLVITRAIAQESFNGVTSSLQQLHSSTLNCSALESELEALKNASSSTAVDQFQGDDKPGIIQGYVLSGTLDERFNNSKKVLDDLQIQVHRIIPFSYQSEEVDKALEAYHGSRKYHNDRYKKAFSNRMSFLDLFQKFVDDRSAKLDSWRFFFENDIALNPKVTPIDAHDAILEGMELAAADGIMYLGICGPHHCTNKAHLKNGLEASRCIGACTHAFGLTKWKAGGFLSVVHKMKLPSSQTGMHLDLVFKTYQTDVHKFWYLGSNLKSPLRKMSHYGLLYQDRLKYPSIIDAKLPKNGT